MVMQANPHRWEWGAYRAWIGTRDDAESLASAHLWIPRRAQHSTWFAAASGFRQRATPRGCRALAISMC